jgi:hypothetical protein
LYSRESEIETNYKSGTYICLIRYNEEKEKKVWFTNIQRVKVLYSLSIFKNEIFYCIVLFYLITSTLIVTAAVLTKLSEKKFLIVNELLEIYEKQKETEDNFKPISVN